jgi:hypothetical protein
MTFLTPICLAISLTAEAAVVEKTAQGTGADRLGFMKASAATYTLTTGRDGRSVLKLRPEPVFRLGNQGDGMLLEGAIFLWTDDVDRPGAAAQIFLIKITGPPESEWRHEFTALSTEPLIASQGATARWQPAVGGVRFEPIAGAPKPAEKPRDRLLQMRELAAEFRADDNFWDRGWNALRLLPTPISRFGKTGGTPEDGALFAFVLGTDPEVFLFIEARKGSDGLEWQYAFAPMTCWALRAEPKGRPVWNLPLRATDDPSKPFFDRTDRESAAQEGSRQERSVDR